MSPLHRLAVAAVVAAAAIAPAAAQADGAATPFCINPTLFGGNAAFGAKTNPTLPGRAVAFDGSCSTATADIGLSSVEPDYWTWTFGDGTGASGTSTPSHAYAAAGTYTVTLTESGEYSGGRTWSVSHTVTVLP